MIFAVLAYDYAGDKAGAERKRLAPAHLAHVERVMDRLHVAGPLTDANGQAIGSLLIIEAEDEASARALIESDPYAGAEIWERVEYRPFRAVAGGWVGGAAWKK